MTSLLGHQPDLYYTNLIWLHLGMGMTLICITDHMGFMVMKLYLKSYTYRIGYFILPYFIPTKVTDT